LTVLSDATVPERRKYIAPASDTPGLTGGSKENRHISRDEAQRFAWLNWQSNGCEHGLKRHHVALDGTIQEICDLPRRKSKGVSTRQFGGRC
jgi:hypothetical protein